MKIPRDVSGEELAKLLQKYGYRITRQTGSHRRPITTLKGKHRITIPKHKSLMIGTLSGLIQDVATHLKIPAERMVKVQSSGHLSKKKQLR